jgi:hypothetical protein
MTLFYKPVERVGIIRISDKVKKNTKKKQTKQTSYETKLTVLTSSWNISL